MMQIDTAASTMLAPLRLEDFISKMLRQNGPLRLNGEGTSNVTLGGKNVPFIGKKLTEGRALKVVSAHANRAAAKARVAGLAVVAVVEAAEAVEAATTFRTCRQVLSSIATSL